MKKHSDPCIRQQAFFIAPRTIRPEVAPYDHSSLPLPASLRETALLYIIGLYC